jgi:hypothetical protein
MIKKITFSVFLLLFGLNILTAQVVFDWETATTIDTGNGMVTSETKAGVTASFSGDFYDSGSVGFYGLCFNNVLVGGLPVGDEPSYVYSVKFTFNKPVNVNSITAINIDSSSDSNYVFSTLDGGNVDRLAFILGGFGKSVNLNWNNVSEFTVSTTAYVIFGFDNLNITPIPTLNNDDFELNKATIYPNPVSDLLNIKNVYNLKSMSLYNPLGQLILESKNETIDFNQYQSGIYTLKIYSSNGVETRRIIKK